MRVVDLSANQTITSYSAFNAAVDATYIRVRRSNGLQDSSANAFHDNITKPRAPYIFLRPPGTESFASQFASFWSMANAIGTWEWGPVIDAEYAGLTAADLRGAITACRHVTGRPLLYVYIGHADLVGGVPFSSFATDSNIRVIGSRYFQNNFASAFADFGLDDPHLDMVQYWDAVSCPGVATPCDNNNARRLIPIGAPDMEATDTTSDSGPGHWDHNWLNTNAIIQDIRNGQYGLQQLGAKLDSVLAGNIFDAAVQDAGPNTWGHVILNADQLANSPDSGFAALKTSIVSTDTDVQNHTATVDSATLDAAVLAALTAAGWTPPPSATDTAQAVLAAIAGASVTTKVTVDPPPAR